jgi:hypothetical protein
MKMAMALALLSEGTENRRGDPLPLEVVGCGKGEWNGVSIVGF